MKKGSVLGFLNDNYLIILIFIVGVIPRFYDLGGESVWYDEAVSIAVSTPVMERNARRLVFQTGPLGRSRSALAAAAFLLETLRSVPSPTDRY